MKRATHSNTHQQHSQKHSQRQVSGDFFGDDFTANLTGDLTGNLTGAAQRPLVAISEIRPPYPHHGYSGSDVPGRASGWRPGFSVTAAGSGSMNRSSRSARHRSSGLPERHRACRASERARAWWGMHWLTDASPERDARARLGRVATRDGRSTPSRLTTRWAGRLPRHSMRSTCPSAFPSLTPPADRLINLPIASRSLHSVTCTFTFIDRHLPFLLQPFTSLFSPVITGPRDPSARHRCIPDAGVAGVPRR